MSKEAYVLAGRDSSLDSEAIAGHRATPSMTESLEMHDMSIRKGESVSFDPSPDRGGQYLTLERESLVEDTIDRSISAQALNQSIEAAKVDQGVERLRYYADKYKRGGPELTVGGPLTVKFRASPGGPRAPRSESQEKDSSGEEAEEEVVELEDIELQGEGSSSRRGQPEKQGLAVPGKNATGRLINKILAQYSQAERQPRYRGNLFCIYFASKSEPVFVIGPQWQYAIAMLVVTNFVVGAAVDTLKDDNWMHPVCLAALYAWDFLTVYLILINPGLSPRDPRVHTRQYLRHIEENSLIYKLCSRC